MTAGPRAGTIADGATRLFYVYDAWNRLVEVWEDTNDDGDKDAEGTDTQLIACEYDGLNRRIVKTDKTGENDVVYDYYYDILWRVLEIHKDGGTDYPEKQYIWGVNYIDAPVCRFRDDDTDGSNIETVYYMYDANFNVVGLYSDGGSLLERYMYDPYGTPYNVASGSLTAYDNEIFFCGYRYDNETGLYHVRRRYYQPALGSWLTHDPLGYIDGANLYQYVRSRPANLSDPLGLDPPLSTIESDQDDYFPKHYGGPTPAKIRERAKEKEEVNQDQENEREPADYIIDGYVHSYVEKEIEWIPGHPKFVSPSNEYKTTPLGGETTSGLNIGKCPKCALIFVHGWDTKDKDAGNWAGERITKGYKDACRRKCIPPCTVFNFIWDARKAGAFGSGWSDAKERANEVANTRFAAFIRDFRDKCPETRIHIMAHSLGARVVLKALQTSDNGVSGITSVILVNPAVDDDVLEEDEEFEDAPKWTEKMTVVKDEGDDTLELYQIPEGHESLGEDGPDDPDDVKHKDKVKTDDRSDDFKEDHDIIYKNGKKVIRDFWDDYAEKIQ